MIQWNHVSKFYGKRILYEDVNLHLQNAGIYYIVGDNGTGKTTLLKLIAKLTKPNEGQIEIQGKTIFINNEITAFTALTVYENLRMVCPDIEKINTVLKLMNLEEVKTSASTVLSYGEKIRLAIARAYLLEADILLFDEPTANIDKENREQFYSLIERLSKEKIILITTNVEEEIAQAKNKIEIEACELKVNITDIHQAMVKKEKTRFVDSKLFRKAYRYPMGISICLAVLMSLSILFFNISTLTKQKIVLSSVQEDIPYIVMPCGYIENTTTIDYISSHYLEKNFLDSYCGLSYEMNSILLFRDQTGETSDIANLLFYSPEKCYINPWRYELKDNEAIMTSYLYECFKIRGLITEENQEKYFNTLNKRIKIVNIINLDYQDGYEDYSYIYNERYADYEPDSEDEMNYFGEADYSFFLKNIWQLQKYQIFMAQNSMLYMNTATTRALAYDYFSYHFPNRLPEMIENLDDAVETDPDIKYEIGGSTSYNLLGEPYVYSSGHCVASTAYNDYWLSLNKHNINYRYGTVKYGIRIFIADRVISSDEIFISVSQSLYDEQFEKWFVAVCSPLYTVYGSRENIDAAVSHGLIALSEALDDVIVGCSFIDNYRLLYTILTIVCFGLSIAGIGILFYLWFSKKKDTLHLLRLIHLDKYVLRKNLKARGIQSILFLIAFMAGGYLAYLLIYRIIFQLSGVRIFDFKAMIPTAIVLAGYIFIEWGFTRKILYEDFI